MMENFIEYLYSKFLLSDGVSIDTRTIQKGDLFFALKGPNFNANPLAKEALQKGAAYAVVDELEYATDERIIVAEDAQEALQKLAVFHRSRFKRPVFGITGSNGKTTSKELFTRVLSKKYHTLATKGNLNNHLGVPLTLLSIHPQVEIAVVEMGANAVGEIKVLSEFAQPTHGLITNIGEAHTEGFGGIEGVLRGKSELFDYLRKTNGVAFINALDNRLAHMSKRFDHPVVYPDERLILRSADPFIQFSLDDATYSTQLVGAYNFQNIAAAVAVGQFFEVPDEDICEAICTYTPDNSRSQIIRKDNITIINDCYNANPTSMQAALENLRNIKGKKIAILGEMKELDDPEAKHKAVGELLNELNLDEVILIGEHMSAARKQIKDVHFIEHISSIDEILPRLSLDESTILIKGSRSVGLEKVAQKIIDL